MIEVSTFYNTLLSYGVTFFTGIPDSLLKHFCNYINERVLPENHIISANEGGAVGIASGYNMATGKIPLVYMQNSGLGNTVNPLVSLADKDVYSIPLFLLIGWRGEPDIKDEPQHVKQGQITLSLLETLQIPYKILPDENNEMILCLKDIIKTINKTQAPCALVVKKNTFKSYNCNIKSKSKALMTREEAIKIIINNTDSEDIIISTTGKISRELYEHREKTGKSHETDFLTVGSMGHASQIALGISINRPLNKIYCLDGDGAAIMHMGSLAIIGAYNKVSNFVHIILNNGVHDSVGGLPTVGFKIDFCKIAKGCGYNNSFNVHTVDELKQTIKAVKNNYVSGPFFINVIVKNGSRKDLGRPKSTPIDNKKSFTRFIRNETN